MSRTENLVRVILRPDGSVHIAFRDIRSIYATPTNLLELFSNPIDFISNSSFSYKESTFEINRKRVVLEEVLGLTLAFVNSDKQIICDFPELFQSVFASEENEKNSPLNMSSFKLETILSDEKSYLLRYYLEFTNHLTSVLTIKNNIKLRNEIQSEIIREILNTFFTDTLPEKASLKDLSSQITQMESSVIYGTTPQKSDMITANQYAELLHLHPQTIKKYIHDNRLKSAQKTPSGYWLIDKNDRPLNWDLRKGRKRKPTETGKHYKRRSNGSAEDVRQYILKNNLFSDKIAQYIHTYEELEYYTKRNYHEVCWDGRAALIIDVNPEYISNEGKSNKEIMLKGRPPHIPDRNKDKYRYHIHHIGQHINSPFAIIPEYDHNGVGYSSVFHQGSPKENLHTPEFEALKINFWKNYIQKYDEAGKYSLMEYYNHRSKRNKE